MQWAGVALDNTVGGKASVAACRASARAAAEHAALSHARRRLRCGAAAHLSGLQRLQLLHDRLHRRRLCSQDRVTVRQARSPRLRTTAQY